MYVKENKSTWKRSRVNQPFLFGRLVNRGGRRGLGPNPEQTTRRTTRNHHNHPRPPRRPLSSRRRIYLATGILIRTIKDLELVYVLRRVCWGYKDRIGCRFALTTGIKDSRNVTPEWDEGDCRNGHRRQAFGNRRVKPAVVNGRFFVYYVRKSVGGRDGGKLWFLTWIVFFFWEGKAAVFELDICGSDFAVVWRVVVRGGWF